MADELWLGTKRLAALTNGKSFFVDCDASGNDAISLRLRAEIVEWLGCPLVSDSHQASVILKTIPLDAFMDRFPVSGPAKEDSWHIHAPGHSVPADPIVIESPSNRGLLYGFYAWLDGAGQKNEDATSCPQQPIRMVDQWDQADGSVERGYAGESVFFGRWTSNVHSEFVSFPQRGQNDVFRGDVDRIVEYGRFLASTGINAICLNNVNVRGYAIHFIKDPWLVRIGQIARILESFGLRVFLAVNFAAPKIISGLKTVDPCDPDVQDWWDSTVNHIYERIPQFGGFVVKADSEGEPGPYKYGRSHAQGANMFAKALQPHGGIVVWRAFVYNSHTDWRDRTCDRAKAAWENFHDLDGQFASNAILQVKFGPIDFQTSEPLNPLICSMHHTNLMIEYQITAEYLGHQIDLNFPLPQWKHMALSSAGAGTDAAHVLQKHAVDPAMTGFAAVSNVGMDENWTGNPLAQANLFAYGCFCWNPGISCEETVRRWVRLTFPSCSFASQKSIVRMLLESNSIYSLYTAPLGVGFMVNRDGHYGPGPDDYEFSRWGTYHFADRNGIGVDRTQKTGTGYTSQYPPEIASRYESAATTPDDLLLFFHHLPYTYVMPDGRTLIQRIYDDHFAGVKGVERLIGLWKECSGSVGKKTWDEVNRRLLLQLADAREWRDEICTFLYRFSGINDAKGRKIFR